MKLGIAYNVFNGDELLLDSLKNMRRVSEYIVITYQEISNTGIESATQVLDKILNIPKHLYDEFVIFNPNLSKNAQLNEVAKRNLGLKFVKKNNCTHFMSVDCDEFYDLIEFTRAKEFIENGGYESTACELVNYFHSSKYRMVEEKQFVPFIFKISWWDKHKYSAKFPVPVDPTRRLKNRKFHLFDTGDLLMHHMSYVRKDYDSVLSKLINSPNRKMYDDILSDYLEYFNNWDQSQPVMNPHQFKKSLGSRVTVVLNPIRLSIKYLRS